MTTLGCTNKTNRSMSAPIYQPTSLSIYFPEEIDELITKFVPLCKECNVFGCYETSKFEFRETRTRIGGMSRIYENNKIKKFHLPYCKIISINQDEIFGTTINLQFGKVHKHIIYMIKKWTLINYIPGINYYNNGRMFGDGDKYRIRFRKNSVACIHGDKAHPEDLRIGDIVEISFNVHALTIGNSKFSFSPWLNCINVIG